MKTVKLTAQDFMATARLVRGAVGYLSRGVKIPLANH